MTLFEYQVEFLGRCCHDSTTKNYNFLLVEFKLSYKFSEE